VHILGYGLDLDTGHPLNSSAILAPDRDLVAVGKDQGATDCAAPRCVTSWQPCTSPPPGPTLLLGDLSVKVPGHLPGQLTSFVGREATIATVRERLQADRLVSLIGPGGCGKTRLAIEVGREVAACRPDGVFFVDLSGISDPALVPGAVVGALGLQAAPGRDPVGVLVSRLSERDVLLILDNCEHLVDACAALVDALVRGCPRCGPSPPRASAWG